MAAPGHKRVLHAFGGERLAPRLVAADALPHEPPGTSTEVRISASQPPAVSAATHRLIFNYHQLEVEMGPTRAHGGGGGGWRWLRSRCPGAMRAVSDLRLPLSCLNYFLMMALHDTQVAATPPGIALVDVTPQIRELVSQVGWRMARSGFVQNKHRERAWS